MCEVVTSDAPCGKQIGTFSLGCFFGYYLLANVTYLLTQLGGEHQLLGDTTYMWTRPSLKPKSRRMISEEEEEEEHEEVHERRGDHEEREVEEKEGGLIAFRDTQRGFNWGRSAWFYSRELCWWKSQQTQHLTLHSPSITTQSITWGNRRWFTPDALINRYYDTRMDF